MDISVFFTSDLTSSERRVSPQWKVSYLKQRIEQFTGIAPEHQKLQYYPHNTSNEFILLDSESLDLTVADLNIVEFGRIHVQDCDPNSHLADLAQDQANDGYRLSEEAYQNRNDSVLQWKKKEQLGRFDPSYEARVQQLESESVISAASMKVGDRCRIINIGGERRGEVKYIGKIPALDEGKKPWVGVEFDEPVGKNDGSLDGVRYFNAKPGYGSFVTPNKVEVGDFPEENLFNSDDEEL
ncbi:hypothetical protein PUMCH_002998 [Australozyma saopauloensis]|uniref:CAP-Gly domain-containing protein n=1 Tax=Australozyma saopauloensis TaxID=291208 RepID=A0AAX4HAT4_9ASCO|nr:hypothetical protein PUMCH_002998 [[Candida] saopauloensis]